MWHKARSMRYPMESELKNNGLCINFASHYTMSGDNDTLLLKQEYIFLNIFTDFKYIYIYIAYQKYTSILDMIIQMVL